jgi:phage protein U
LSARSPHQRATRLVRGDEASLQGEDADVVEVEGVAAPRLQGLVCSLSRAISEITASRLALSLGVAVPLFAATTLTIPSAL